jgi:hypothetical protein
LTWWQEVKLMADFWLGPLLQAAAAKIAAGQSADAASAALVAAQSGVMTAAAAKVRDKRPAVGIKKLKQHSL